MLKLAKFGRFIITCVPGAATIQPPSSNPAIAQSFMPPDKILQISIPGHNENDENKIGLCTKRKLHYKAHQTS